MSEDSVAEITAFLATKQKEKEKRQMNIIVCNLTESSVTEGPTRKQDGRLLELSLSSTTEKASIF